MQKKSIKSSPSGSFRQRFQTDFGEILVGDTDKYALLRELLGEVSPLFDDSGRPYLVGGPFISLSDSATPRHPGSPSGAALSQTASPRPRRNPTLSAVAVSHTQPVGLDLQYHTYRPRVAAKYFSPAERELLAHSARPAAAFARIWARKEAYAKTLGTGLTPDLLALDTYALSGFFERTIGDFCLAAYAPKVL